MIRAGGLLPKVEEPLVHEFGFRIALQTKVHVCQRIHQGDDFGTVRTGGCFAQPERVHQQRLGVGIFGGVAMQVGEGFDSRQNLRVTGRGTIPQFDGALETGPGIVGMLQFHLEHCRGSHIAGEIFHAEPAAVSRIAMAF